MDLMTSAGQSPRDSCNLTGVRGSLRPTFDSSGGRRAAEVTPARRTSSDVNLRRDLRVGSWNILTLLEDYGLPHLSNELSRLRMDIVGLSETRRPGSGEISSRGFTYYWHGMTNGGCLKGVDISVSSRLQPVRC